MNLSDQVEVPAHERLDELARLRAELAQWRTWGVIEIMIRNPNVDSFVKESEAEIERLRASQAKDDVYEVLKLERNVLQKICAERSDEIERLRASQAKLVEALEEIRTWARAYPVAVFPEPDFKRAHEILSAAGISLDAISAANMRHVITQVAEIVGRALASDGREGEW